MTFPVFIENDDHYQYLKDELKFSDSEIIKTYPEHKPFFLSFKKMDCILLKIQLKINYCILIF